MINIPVYCVVRTQRGYNYDNFDELDPISSTHNTKVEYMNAFTQFWKSIFSYPYAQVRRELRQICYDSIKSAKFDNVYWCLDDFVDDLPNVGDALIYYTDDDDWVRSDMVQCVKQNYIDGFDGLVWTHLRILPFCQQILSPNEPELMLRDGTYKPSNFYPTPYIQSNHCVLRYPTDKSTQFGNYLHGYNYKLPVNHSCINHYLHSPNKKFLYINEVLSIYNSTPASIAYYENDLMLQHNPDFIEKFKQNCQQYYEDTRKFVEESLYGNLHLFPTEFEPHLEKTKAIFKKCL